MDPSIIKKNKISSTFWYASWICVLDKAIDTMNITDRENLENLFNKEIKLISYNSYFEKKNF